MTLNRGPYSGDLLFSTKCFPQRNANRYDAEVTCPLVT